MNRFAKWMLALIVVILLAVAGVAYLYFEGLGVSSGLFWKNECAVWQVNRPGAQVLADVSRNSLVQPVSLTVRNVGEQNLVMPYLRDDDFNPWSGFADQVAAIIEPLARPQDQAIALTRWINQSFMPAGSVTEIRNPWQMMYAVGFGDCYESAYLLTLAAQAAGLEARMVGLTGHVISEIYYEEQWHVFDPFYAYSFYTDDGRIPSYEEIRAAGDPEEFLTDNRHPWVHHQLTRSVWTHSPKISKPEPPEDWVQLPIDFVLQPGESWSVHRVRHRDWYADAGGGIDIQVGKGLLDLLVTAGEKHLTLPFPITRVWLTADGEFVEAESVQLTTETDIPLPEYRKWEIDRVGGGRLLLLDTRAHSTSLFSFMLRISDPLPDSTRLVVETNCAAHWVPTPQPGMTALHAGWRSGDRAEFTLRWRRK